MVKQEQRFGVLEGTGLNPAAWLENTHWSGLAMVAAAKIGGLKPAGSGLPALPLFLECGDMSPLFPDATCRVDPWRSRACALQRRGALQNSWLPRDRLSAKYFPLP